MIPYHLMTTFEDGTKGFRWPEVRSDRAITQFISDNKKYFRVNRVNLCRFQSGADYVEYRIILANRPKIIVPKSVFRLAIALNIGCNVLNLANLYLKSPHWDNTWGLAGVMLGCFLSVVYVFANFNNDDYVLRPPDK